MLYLYKKIICMLKRNKDFILMTYFMFYFMLNLEFI